MSLSTLFDSDEQRIMHLVTFFFPADRKELNMPKPSYEFRYATRKQKVYLLLFKAFFVAMILSSLWTLSLSGQPNLSKDLLYASGTMTGIFGYINLMRVKVEIQEIFEPPIQWQGTEFCWMAMIMLVASYFL